MSQIPVYRVKNGAAKLVNESNSEFRDADMKKSMSMSGQRKGGMSVIPKDFHSDNLNMRVMVTAGVTSGVTSDSSDTREDFLKYSNISSLNTSCVNQDFYTQGPRFSDECHIIRIFFHKLKAVQCEPNGCTMRRLTSYLTQQLCDLKTDQNPPDKQTCLLFIIRG